MLVVVLLETNLLDFLDAVLKLIALDQPII
jgi:hypothetical protein